MTAPESAEWSALMELPPSRTSPRSARRLLELAAQEWDLPDLDSAELLLTELVTNAAIHARTDMIVRLTLTDQRLRVAVSDCSGLLPEPRHPTIRSENGRGLLLLQQLSHDWGWQEDGSTSTCKTVWFELDHRLPATSAAFDMESVDAL